MHIDLQASRSTVVRTGVLVGALLAAFASPASTRGVVRTAQADAPQVREGGSPQGVRPSGPVASPRGRRDSQDPQAMADRLRDLLQLSPSQEPALQAFAAAMRSAQRRTEGDGEDAKATVDERLDALASTVRTGTEATLARVQAAKAFYATLTPPQRKAADRLLLKGANGSRRDPLRTMILSGDGGRPREGMGDEGPGGRGPLGDPSRDGFGDRP